MSIFLVSYTVLPAKKIPLYIKSAERIRKGMRAGFENYSNCQYVDDTLWYVESDLTCRELYNVIAESANKLILKPEDNHTIISIYVNEVTDWEVFNDDEVENWLFSKDTTLLG